MSLVKNPGMISASERRLKERRRVNFLLDDDGFSRASRASGEKDLWSCARRGSMQSGRWDAFEQWQEEAKEAQAKVVDGVRRLPRKLSLKAIFKAKNSS